jgi:glycosyltransferase involved in cell wall biosynthesis
MEQALGHVAYTRNLQSAFAAQDRLSAVWMPVAYSSHGILDGLPVAKNNWTLRGSLRGYSVLRAEGGPGRFDALFFHTQTVAMLAPLVAWSAPVIASLDATPINFDCVGAFYQHKADSACRVEAVKRALYHSVFVSSSAITTWSQWAKDSLRDDYGVDPDRVTVIPPGVDCSVFPYSEKPLVAEQERRTKILFVGGDFERKGGPLLLACMRAGLAEQCELHIVTTSAVPDAPGIHVYRDLGPNDPRLVRLYREADIFALPTYADCLAVVLAEAMASGLPIVTTSVGAQPEAVSDGRSGIIIPPGDELMLGRALRRLAADPDLRRSMGREGRAIAESRFDARANARALTKVIFAGIDRWRQRRRAYGRSSGRPADRPSPSYWPTQGS